MYCGGNFWLAKGNPSCGTRKTKRPGAQGACARRPARHTCLPAVTEAEGCGRGARALGGACRAHFRGCEAPPTSRRSDSIRLPALHTEVRADVRRCSSVGARQEGDGGGREGRGRAGGSSRSARPDGGWEAGAGPRRAASARDERRPEALLLARPLALLPHRPAALRLRVPAALTGVSEEVGF